MKRISLDDLKELASRFTEEVRMATPFCANDFIVNRFLTIVEGDEIEGGYLNEVIDKAAKLHWRTFGDRDVRDKEFMPWVVPTVSEILFLDLIDRKMLHDLQWWSLKHLFADVSGTDDEIYLEKGVEFEADRHYGR